MEEPLNWPGKSRSGLAATIIGSVQVLPANPRRRGATICNDSANVMYLTKGDTAIINTGVRLNAAGGSYELNRNNLWLGIISVYCAVAAQNISWSEDE